MSVKLPGPMTVCGNFTKVSASCISRLASLNGLVTRMSSCTPGSTSSVRGSTALRLPVMPMAVRVAPGSGCGVSCRRLTAASTCSTCSGVACLSMTTSMAVFLERGPRLKKLDSPSRITAGRPLYHPPGAVPTQGNPAVQPREEWKLPTRHLGRRILVFDELDSTNTVAAQLAQGPDADG